MTNKFNIPEAINDRKLLAVCEFKGNLYIATERGLYKKIGDILCRVKFEDENVG